MVTADPPRAVPLGPGRVCSDDPERWEVAVATLGASGDRFTEVPRTEVGHTEGRAIEVVVPVVDGWSVVRLTR